MDPAGHQAYGQGASVVKIKVSMPSSIADEAECTIVDPSPARLSRSQDLIRLLCRGVSRSVSLRTGTASKSSTVMNV